MHHLKKIKNFPRGARENVSPGPAVALDVLVSIKMSQNRIFKTQGKNKMLKVFRVRCISNVTASKINTKCLETF